MKKLNVVYCISLAISLFLSSVPVISARVIYEPYNPYILPPSLPGDITMDGKTDLKDYFMACKSYGSVLVGPSPRPWNPQADLDEDGCIGLKDIFQIGKNFGEYELPDWEAKAYASVMEFEHPYDIDPNTEFHFHIFQRLYIPASLSGQRFYLCSESNGVVCDVKLNCRPIDGEGSRIDLGPLCFGYYLLKFEFCEYGHGLLNQRVESQSGPYAWIIRNRVCMPCASIQQCSAKFLCWFPADALYLFGQSEGAIKQIYRDDQLIWDGWEWDGYTLTKGDGFSYPIFDGAAAGSHTIEVIYRDFPTSNKYMDTQIVCWTSQRQQLGNPKFQSTLVFKPNNVQGTEYGELIQRVRLANTTINAGSKWLDAEHPMISDRYFFTQLSIGNGYIGQELVGMEWTETNLGFSVNFDLATKCDWCLTPAQPNDIMVLMNLTLLALNVPKPEPEPYKWYISLKNISLAFSSYEYVELTGVEHYPQGNSIVKPDYLVALDYFASVLMFGSAFLAPQIGLVAATLGSFSGLGMHGVIACNKFEKDQRLDPYMVAEENLHLVRIEYQNKDNFEGQTGPIRVRNTIGTQSDSETVFFGLNPVSGKRAGATLLTMNATLELIKWDFDFGYSYYSDIGDLQISTFIPWFTTVG